MTRTGAEVIRELQRAGEAEKSRRRRRELQQRQARERLAYDNCRMTHDELLQTHRQMREDFYRREVERRAKAAA